jgi:hypothetical protein
MALGCAAVALCVAAGIAFAAGPSSDVIRSVALENGTHRYVIRVPHRTGRQPPAFWYTTSPRKANCRVADYGYRALRGKGALRLVLACSGVKGGRASVRISTPYVRTFPLSNKTGDLDIRLQKPPGPSAPLLLLTTKPAQPGKCQARDSDLSITRNLFHLHLVAECAGLEDGTRGVLTVGGLLLGPKPAGLLRVSATASHAGVTPAGRVLTADTPECTKTEIDGTARYRYYRLRCKIVLPGFWSGTYLRNDCQYLWSEWGPGVSEEYVGRSSREIPENVYGTWGSDAPGAVLLDATNWAFESKTLGLQFDCKFRR